MTTDPTSGVLFPQLTVDEADAIALDLVGAATDPITHPQSGPATTPTAFEKSGRWKQVEVCERISTRNTLDTRSPSTDGHEWATRGNVEAGGEGDFVFNANGPTIDGFIGCTLTIPPSTCVLFNYEAGHLAKPGVKTKYGTPAAYRLMIIASGQILAEIDREISPEAPDEYIRNEGFVFKCPADAVEPVEIEIQFHDQTSRQGVARDLRIRPLRTLTATTDFKDIYRWDDRSRHKFASFYTESQFVAGNPEDEYFPDPSSKITEGECPVDIDAISCAQPNRRLDFSRGYCDVRWSFREDNWVADPVAVIMHIPDEGPFTYEYEKRTADGKTEKVGLKGRLMKCEPLPPKPDDCPTEDYASCTEITSEGLVTYTKHTHTPCDGDAVVTNTYGGDPYELAGVPWPLDSTGCVRKASKEEAEAAETRTTCPSRLVENCDDTIDGGAKVITFTKITTKECDDTEKVVRTYKGEPYELQGTESGCVQRKNEEEASKNEKEETCPSTSTWHNCLDDTPEGILTYSLEKVFDCHGKEIARNRFYDGKPYIRVTNGRDCVDRKSREDAREHEGLKTCPIEKKFQCTETIKGRTSPVIDSRMGSIIQRGGSTWNRDDLRDRYSTTVDGVEITFAGGYPHNYAGNPNGILRTHNSRSGNLILEFSEPVWVELSAAWCTGGEGIRFVGGDVEPAHTPVGFVWNESRSEMIRVAGRPWDTNSQTGIRTTKAVTRLEMAQAGRSDNLFGVTNLRIAKANGGKQDIVKIVTTDCDKKESTRYELNGSSYTPTGEVSDCKPLN